MSMCRDYEEQAILREMDLLDAVELEALQVHIQQCSACRDGLGQVLSEWEADIAWDGDVPAGLVDETILRIRQEEKRGVAGGRHGVSDGMEISRLCWS